MSFHHEAGHGLFDGDTLFPGGPGSTNDELGDFEVIIASIPNAHTDDAVRDHHQFRVTASRRRSGRKAPL